MKNIHILPTPNLSRLGFDSVKNLHFVNDFIDDYQHIYITSDEEIKEGDWYINTFVIEREQKPQTHTEKRHLLNHQKDYRFKYCKKIILTTDQDLDGVQAIDDEFLEWFVNNSSCESFEVVEQELNTDYRSDWKQKFYYKIIIPKEKLEGIPKGTINMVIGKPKQETLEEAAEKYQMENGGAYSMGLDDAFYNGAKWQQERSYSEEEVKEILKLRLNWFRISSNEFEDNKWFNKFKKK